MPSQHITNLLGEGADVAMHFLSQARKITGERTVELVTRSLVHALPKTSSRPDNTNLM